MKACKFFSIVILVLTISSCSLSPTADIEMSTPIDINSEWQGLALNTAPLQNGWLDDLAMNGLSNFVAEVMKHNPNFNEVALRMQAAGYNANAAAGRLLPRLGTSGTTSQNRASTSIQNNTSNSFSMGLDASWEVDVWGRISASSAVERSTFEVAQYDFYGARLSLAAQVAQSWFDVIEAKQQYELSSVTVLNYERANQIIRNRFGRGLSSGLDLRLATTSLEAAKATEKQRESLYNQALRKLEVFAGRYPLATIKVAGEMPNELGDIPVGVPLDLLERRPDLQSAKARLRAAGYRAKAAEKAMLPSISITARGGNTTKQFSDLLKFDHIFWNLIGGITQPIFQGGQLRYGAKAEQMNFEAQKQNYVQTLLRAFKEVEDALDQDRSLAARVEHTELAAQNAVAAEAVALEQYSQGLIRISTLLQSQRSSLTQQSQLLSIKKQRINNRISLYLSLGGDFILGNTLDIQENINLITKNYKLNKNVSSANQESAL